MENGQVETSFLFKSDISKICCFCFFNFFLLQIPAKHLLFCDRNFFLFHVRNQICNGQLRAQLLGNWKEKQFSEQIISSERKTEFKSTLRLQRHLFYLRLSMVKLLLGEIVWTVEHLSNQATSSNIYITKNSNFFFFFRFLRRRCRDIKGKKMLKDKTDNASWWIKLLWDGKTLNFSGKNGSKKWRNQKKKKLYVAVYLFLWTELIAIN